MRIREKDLVRLFFFLKIFGFFLFEFLKTFLQPENISEYRLIISDHYIFARFI